MFYALSLMPVLPAPKLKTDHWKNSWKKETAALYYHFYGELIAKVSNADNNTSDSCHPGQTSRWQVYWRYAEPDSLLAYSINSGQMYIKKRSY